MKFTRHTILPAFSLKFNFMSHETECTEKSGARNFILSNFTTYTQHFEIMTDTIQPTKEITWNGFDFFQKRLIYFANVLEISECKVNIV